MAQSWIRCQKQIIYYYLLNLKFFQQHQFEASLSGKLSHHLLFMAQ